jgi:DNA-binding transcriptional MerR regulator
MTTPPAPELIGSLEAARRLRINRATLNHWVERGLVPFAGKAEGRTGARLFDAAVIEDIARERIGA